MDKEISLHFRPVIDTGGRGVFFWINMVASADLHSSGVVIELSDPAPGARQWLPDIEAGFAEFQAECQREGKPLGFLRLAVTQVTWHESDTNSWVVRYVSREALREVFRKAQGGLELPID